MSRLALVFVLLAVIAWAFWRFVDGVIDTFGGRPAGARRKGPSPVKLVRDPSCGTWVDPRSALAVQAGGNVYHFCSTKCRDEFRRTA